MCRGNDHNGRRCPSDTSEARMLRRRNAVARIKYAGQASQPVEIKLPAEPAVPFTAESIREDAESLKELAFEMRQAGEPFENILLTYDETLNRMGAGIDYLATEKYGAPTDEDLQNAEVEMAERARREADARRKLLVEKDEQLTEEVKALRDKLHEIANPITHPILKERWAAWDEKAPELHKEWKDKEDELGDNRVVLYKSHSNVKSSVHDGIKELLEKRNEAMQAALRDVGVQFADPETFKCSEDSHPDAVKSLKLALKYFPQEWVDHSNNDHDDAIPLRIKRSTGRAHYTSKAEQREMRSMTKASIYEKPADWVPNPHDRNDSEYVDLNGAMEWVDPKSGIKHSHHMSWSGKSSEERGTRAWLKMEYEYKRQDKAPSGPEWEKVELRDSGYRDGKYVEDEHLTTYYRKPKVEREKSGRRNYKAELLISRDNVVHVGENSGMRVALHEFSHRVEHVVMRVAVYEDAFLKRRAGLISANGTPQPETLISLNGVPIDEENSNAEKPKTKTKKKSEVGYKDNFAHQYMGKVYPSSMYKEILSMGMESLFAGTHGGLSGLHNNKPDPDYKKFILGVLASSASNAVKR